MKDLLSRRVRSGFQTGQNRHGFKIKKKKKCLSHNCEPVSSLNKAGSLMKMYYAKVYFSKLGDETNTYYHALRSSVFDLFIVCIAL